jgi:hypothetical protein
MAGSLRPHHFFRLRLAHRDPSAGHHARNKVKRYARDAISSRSYILRRAARNRHACISPAINCQRF